MQIFRKAQSLAVPPSLESLVGLLRHGLVTQLRGQAHLVDVPVPQDEEDAFRIPQKQNYCLFRVYLVYMLRV